MNRRSESEGDVVRHMLGLPNAASTRDVVTAIAESAYKAALNGGMTRVLEHDGEKTERALSSATAALKEQETLSELWRQSNYDVGALLGLSGAFHCNEVVPKLKIVLDELKRLRAERR